MMVRSRFAAVKGATLCSAGGRWKSDFCGAPYSLMHRVPLLTGQAVRPASTSGAARSDRSNFIGSPVRGREPHLRRLSVVRPDLVSDWVPELNDVDVGSVPFNSPLVVWWGCSECGEKYQSTVRDRAISDKGCPQCKNIQKSQAVQKSCLDGNGSDSGAALATEAGTTGLAQDVTVQSLQETHPELAIRWDEERNGLLRPSDVTSTSELNVWWRPAKGRPPHETSFRRPVHAFVEMPYSIEEQQEAQSVLELDILRKVREAAKIAEARDHGVLPIPTQLLDNVVLDGQGDVVCTSQKQQCELIGEDLYKAIELWERDFDAKTDAAYRPLFYFTDACDDAGVSRDQVLDAYDRFVTWHRDQGSTRKCSGADPPVVVPSAITDADWIQHFTLSVGDVAKGCLAPDSRLVFPSHEEENTTVTEKQQAEGTWHVEKSRRRVDSLPAPPREFQDEIHTTFAPVKRSYPRRPPLPPNREDNVTETLPTEIQTNKQDVDVLSEHMVGKGASRRQKGGTPSEAAFEVMSLASAQSLVQDYAVEDDKSMLFDVEEKDMHVRTLLGPLAMRSTTNEEIRELQYSRGTPRPVRAGRFRLRHPDDSEGTKRSTVSAALGVENLSSTATKEKQKLSQEIQAPGSPRKVARPQKKKRSS